MEEIYVGIFERPEDDAMHVFWMVSVLHLSQKLRVSENVLYFPESQ